MQQIISIPCVNSGQQHVSGIYKSLYFLFLFAFFSCLSLVGINEAKALEVPKNPLGVKFQVPETGWYTIFLYQSPIMNGDAYHRIFFYKTQVSDSQVVLVMGNQSLDQGVSINWATPTLMNKARLIKAANTDKEGFASSFQDDWLMHIQRFYKNPLAQLGIKLAGISVERRVLTGGLPVIWAELAIENKDKDPFKIILLTFLDEKGFGITAEAIVSDKDPAVVEEMRKILDTLEHIRN